MTGGVVCPGVPANPQVCPALNPCPNIVLEMGNCAKFPEVKANQTRYSTAPGAGRVQTHYIHWCKTCTCYTRFTDPDDNGIIIPYCGDLDPTGCIGTSYVTSVQAVP